MGSLFKSKIKSFTKIHGPRAHDHVPAFSPVRATPSATPVSHREPSSTHHSSCCFPSPGLRCSRTGPSNALRTAFASQQFNRIKGPKFLMKLNCDLSVPTASNTLLRRLWSALESLLPPLPLAAPRPFNRQKALSTSGYLASLTANLWACFISRLADTAVMHSLLGITNCRFHIIHAITQRNYIIITTQL